ncbi:IS21-like element helper ATPase IstB [Heliomicrobium gestii]|nr:IS21-like element helper ATPase IstB [Heliomicrobium gestii]MBM7867312.1 DNA replication protein DnaC [Heliomicrobium gestii]
MRAGRQLDDLLQQCHFHQRSEQLAPMANEATTADLPYLAFLEQVLVSEIDARENKAMESRLRQAGFPYVRTLEDFDFAFQAAISKRHIQQLTTMQWIDDAFNVFFLGPPGTGKTHLSVAIGGAAVDKGYKVRFISMDQLVSAFRTESTDPKAHRALRAIRKADLVIIDELGFLPITRTEANQFFQLVNDLYQRTSIIITSNKSFEEWSEVFGDSVITTAILDRLVHHSELFSLSGDSYRMTHRKTFLTA